MATGTTHGSCQYADGSTLLSALQAVSESWETAAAEAVAASRLARVCVVLVNPTGAQNVGQVARAMNNFGLNDLRLVAPGPFVVPSGQWQEGVAPEYAPEVNEFACAGGARVLHSARCSPSVEAAVRTLAPGPSMANGARQGRDTGGSVHSGAARLSWTPR